MRTEELEDRLREMLRDRAGRITEADLRDGSVAGTHLVPARQRRTVFPQVLAAAAVLMVVLALVAVGLLARDGEPAAERVAHTVGNTNAAPSAKAGVRAWPLNSDQPLATSQPAGDLHSVEAAARQYMTEVIGLPPNWSNSGQIFAPGDTATVKYVLQDVPAEIHLARSTENLWYVTGANTDLIRPGDPEPIDGGIHVPMSRGPRTNEDGVSVRMTVLAASGETLQRMLATKILSSAAQPAQALRVYWNTPELAAAVRVEVVDDHDSDQSTPDVVIGHWTVGLAPPGPSGLPSGTDLSAAPIFEGSGSADEVADAYMRDRFPDHPAPGIDLQPADTRAGKAYVRWATGAGEERHASGRLFLREKPEGWYVLAATTDGVDLSDIRADEGRLKGRIITDNVNSLFADVFQPDNTPAAGSPRPAGQPGAAYRFGTAGGPGNRTLDVDVPVEPGTAIVRVNLAGGTILSISEVRISVPAK